MVVNVGTTYMNEEGSEPVLLPDVNDDARKVARMVTPTPHGVGPMPVSFLAQQTVQLAEAAFRKELTRRKVEQQADARREVKASSAEGIQMPVIACSSNFTAKIHSNHSSSTSTNRMSNRILFVA